MAVGLFAVMFGLCARARASGADSSASADPKVVRPNMVVFLSDDHTQRDSSLYGSPDIKTPHMDRLARTGMTFNNAYVASPSCAPSRAALLTGLYPQHNGAQANHQAPRPELKKLPAYLKELGYEVVAFGKVGHYRQTTQYGFDLSRHFGYHEDIAIPKAIEWLQARESEQPLCLIVGTNWPHVPWPQDSSEFSDDSMVVPPNHVDNAETRNRRAKYVAAIRKMDDDLGAVYDAALAKLGNQTFFLRTSDHGAQWPFGKWTLYDDGIRTPLVVSWPGRIAANSRTDAMVSWIDILPTLVDVAGGKAPTALDGKSFLKVLTAEEQQHRDVIFTTTTGDGNNNVFPIRAVSTPDGWKYIRNIHPEYRFSSHVNRLSHDSGYWPSWTHDARTSEDARRKVHDYVVRPAEELYFVKDDPYEQRNLADDPAARDQLVSLRARLDQWIDETNDQLPVIGNPLPRSQKKRPNIITVLVDDMGWSDLSCFGGTRTETTHVDRLAQEGIRFHQFYVGAPICSPSRAALATGQYPQRWRINSYLANRKLNDERGVAQWLDLNAPMLSRELTKSGYLVGHFGKWHLGGQRDVGDAPLIVDYGFDRSLTNFEGLGPRVLPLKDAYDGKPPQPHALGSDRLGKGPIEWEDRSRITGRFVSAAISMIDEAVACEQPFYINLWPDDVHSPFFPPEALRKGKDGKKNLYYAVLKAMDNQLAPLFDRVRNDPELRDNTLIVLLSDNGHEEGAGQSDPLRGAKTWLYEGGVRSPLIVWGPGLISSKKAGTINNESVLTTMDLNRSFYQLAEAPLPAGIELDGEPHLDTFLGRSTESRQAPIFWRRPPDRPGSKSEDNPGLAVREGKWKYYVNYDGSDPQLYDLLADISETRNLKDEHPDVVARLQKLVTEWNRELPQDAGNPEFQPTASRSGK